MAEWLRFPSDWHIVLLVLGAGLGGHFVGWNDGLMAGFSSMMLSWLFLLSGYLALAVCSAEMTSTLPFSGGNFGFARVALGPYIGYMVGWGEIIQSVLLIASCVAKMGFIISELFGTSGHIEFCYWALLIVLLMGLHYFSGSVRYQSFFFGVAVIILLLIFFVGAISHGNFLGNAESEASPYRHFQGNIGHFNLGSWFFITANIMPIIAGYSGKPKELVPIVVLFCTCTFVFTSLFVMLSATSLPPGTNGLASDVAPLSSGFATLFGMTRRAASMLSILPIFCLAYVFSLAMSRQMTSMANSGLLPVALRGDIKPGEQHGTLTIFLTTLVAMILLRIVVIGWPGSLFNVASAFSYLINLGTIGSYVVFQKKYNGLEKPFSNPFEMYAAGYGGLVFFVSLMTILCYIERFLRALLAVALFVISITIYYILYARTAQCFSEEEQKVLFVAYVINANTRSRLQRTKSMRGLNLHATSQDGSVRSLLLSPHSPSTPSSAARRLGELGRSPSRGLLLPRSLSTHSLNSTSNSGHGMRPAPTLQQRALGLVGNTGSQLGKARMQAMDSSNTMVSADVSEGVDRTSDGSVVSASNKSGTTRQRKFRRASREDHRPTGPVVDKISEEPSSLTLIDDRSRNLEQSIAESSPPPSPGQLTSAAPAASRAYLPSSSTATTVSGASMTPANLVVDMDAVLADEVRKVIRSQSQQGSITEEAVLASTKNHIEQLYPGSRASSSKKLLRLPLLGVSPKAFRGSQEFFPQNIPELGQADDSSTSPPPLASMDSMEELPPFLQAEYGCPATISSSFTEMATLSRSVDSMELRHDASMKRKPGGKEYVRAVSERSFPTADGVEDLLVDCPEHELPSVLDRRRQDRLFRRSLGEVVVPQHIVDMGAEYTPVSALETGEESVGHKEAVEKKSARWIPRGAVSGRYRAGHSSGAGGNASGPDATTTASSSSVHSTNGIATTDSCIGEDSHPAPTTHTRGGALRRSTGWMRSSFNAITANISKVVPFLEDADFEQYTQEFVKAVLTNDPDDPPRSADNFCAAPPDKLAAGRDEEMNLLDLMDVANTSGGQDPPPGGSPRATRVDTSPALVVPLPMMLNASRDASDSHLAGGEMHSPPDGHVASAPTMASNALFQHVHRIHPVD